MHSPETNLPEDSLLPTEAPVMFLRDSVLLPHTHVPLFIFEPRYRAMLAYALEHERMFCLAMMKSHVSDVTTSEDYHHICGIGMVRACVGHEEGTSHLVLQGLARVEIGDLIQQKPFYLAPVRRLEEKIKQGDGIRNLMTEVLQLCRAMIPETEEGPDEIEKITHPGYFADTVAHGFLRDPVRQQEVLESSEITSRLRALLRALKEQNPM